MPLAYSTAIQNRVAIALRGVEYASLDAAEKVVIDGTWGGVGDPTAGFAIDALTEIRQIGQWFSLTTPANVPAEWESWLVARIVMHASIQMGPDRRAVYVERHDDAEMAALDAYARNAITYDPGATPEAATLTVQNIRYYVVAFCVRRASTWETVEGSRRRRPRQWPPFELVDSCIERVLRRLWGEKDWKFKRRQITVTISALGAVTFTGLSGETFHSFATRNLYYNDTDGAAQTIEWLDGDRMAMAKAYEAATATPTGRPRYVRFEDKSGTLAWYFYPAPDAEYTVKAEVYVKGPTLTSLADTTTAMARFPREFDHLIKDAVLAEVLSHLSDPQGRRMLEDVRDEIDRMTPIYAGVGRVDNDQSVRDVYGDYGYMHRWWPYAMNGGL